MTFRPIILPLLAGLLLVGCAATGTPRALFQPASSLAARTADGFFDLAGKPASLAAFAGKPLVLSFLAPGQDDSEAQLPHLIRLQAAYAPEGVAFLVAGEHATPAGLRAYVAGHGLVFPVWEDRGAAAWRQRGFAKLPAHEFLTASGAVAHSHDGFMSRGELLEQLEALKPGR